MFNALLSVFFNHMCALNKYSMPFECIVNPIFHGPGHMWPGIFECLQLQNLLSINLYSWRSIFSIFFASGHSSYNDAFLTYSEKISKNPKMRVIWELGRGNPATLGRENRTCDVITPPPPVLTWSTHLFVIVSCVRRGGGRGPLTWQPIAQNLNVSFNLSKSKYIPITNCQLSRQKKIRVMSSRVNRTCVWLSGHCLLVNSRKKA
jgi:hypothetical protein